MQFITNENKKYILVVNSKKNIDLDYQLLLLLFLKKRGFAPAKYGDLLTQLKIED